MNAPAGERAQGKWMALLAAFLGWMFDGLEMGLFPLAGRPALKTLLSGRVEATQLDASVNEWFGIIIALFLLGAAGGGLLFGWLGDRIGRVKSMIWSVLTYSIFSGLCGLVAAPWQLGLLRFIAALGMGGEWALGVALVMEIWPSSSRPILAGLIGAAANVGFMVAGYLEFIVPAGESSWRWVFVLGAVPALLTFFIRIFVPESEKWQKATQHAPKASVLELLKPGLRGTTLRGALLAGLALVGTWASVQWVPSWTDQFTEKKAKAELLSTPEGKALAPEALAKAVAERKPKSVRTWTQNWLAAGAIVFTIGVALVAQVFNRRLAYFGLCVFSLIACQYLFRAGLDYGPFFLFITFLVGGLTAGFYGWLPLYLPELFPTRIRATGAGFAFNIGRVLSAAGAIVGGQLSKNVFGGDLAQMCAALSLVYVVGIGLIWLCPETKGKPLPE